MRGWTGIVGALALLAVLGGVGWIVLADSEPAPAPPAPPAAPEAAAAPGRTALPPPPGVEPPPPSREPRPPAQLTPEDRKLMNVSVDEMLKVVRTECLQGWVNTQPAQVELVFDVVLSDGSVMDIGMRPLGVEVPQETVSCVADKAWMAEWPEWDLPG